MNHLFPKLLLVMMFYHSNDTPIKTDIHRQNAKLYYLNCKAVYQSFGYQSIDLPLWQIKVRILTLLMMAHQLPECSVELSPEVHCSRRARVGRVRG